MDLAQMRNRLAAILAQLDVFKNLESFSQEDVDNINALSEEFETLSAQITAAEKIEAMTQKSTESTRKVAPQPATKPEARIEVRPSQKELNGGFTSYGEFLGAVRKSSLGEIDRRFQNTFFEKNGEDGAGFMVPEQFIADVSKKLSADESLLAKTRQFTVSGNNLTLPTDETSPWNGGVQAYWVAEGAQLTESGTKFGQSSWKLHKLAAMVKITDELLDDSLALESYVRSMAPEAIMHKINSAIISGNGVGKPNGILNTGFKVQVAKESAQASDTIVARNIIKMYSKMIPAARAGAVWYINPMVEEQLRTLKDDLGNFIYLAPGSQLNQTPYGVLMGLPVVPLIGSIPQLGDEGDVILANLNYYYTILKSGGMKQAVSQHLYFDRDIQAYKFTMRIDGGCPFKTPVTTEFGGYQMSAIVTLEAR